MTRSANRPAPPHPLLGRSSVALACALSLSVACKSGSADKPPAASATTDSKGTTVERFGDAFVSGPSVALATLLSEPASFADKSVITEGKVERACSRKGCWMEISQGDDKCRVTFKDYGFFVPKDSAGAEARIQGTVQTRAVAAADVQHLESEGARFSNKNPDGTATEVRMVATAVELKR